MQPLVDRFVDQFLITAARQHFLKQDSNCKRNNRLSSVRNVQLTVFRLDELSKSQHMTKDGMAWSYSIRTT